MRMTRIYTADHLKSQTTIRLDKPASHHLLRVLRLKPDHPLIIFNGQGGEYTATLVAVDGKVAVINIESHQQPSVESPLQIELGQGISRGERMDYAIQKSVELGVHKITPLLTERCGVKLSASRWENRLAHWQAVIISACEQSGRCLIPEINTPRVLTEWLEEKRPGLQLVCDPTASTDNSNLPKPVTQTTVLIGPEGGLTQGEVDYSEKSGFVGLSLGPRILRTETAAVAAITLLQSRWGDMRAGQTYSFTK